MDFEYIDEGDMSSNPRGRKSSVPPELVDALRKLPKGKAVRINGFRVDMTTDDAKNRKASTGAVIRSAGKQAGLRVSITWSPDGVPQVMVKAGRK